MTKQQRVCGSALDDAARECEELAAAVAARCDARMLTYAHVCSRMRTSRRCRGKVRGTYPQVCSRMLTYAHAARECEQLAAGVAARH